MWPRVARDLQKNERACIWIISAGVAFFVAWFVAALFGSMAIRHHELYIDPILQFFFFTFTPLKRAGLDNGIAFLVSQMIFGLLVFVGSSIAMCARRRRSRTKSQTAG